MKQKGMKTNEKNLLDSGNLVEAYHDEAEWAERKQAAIDPDVIIQKNIKR